MVSLNLVFLTLAQEARVNYTLYTCQNFSPFFHSLYGIWAKLFLYHIFFFHVVLNAKMMHKDCIYASGGLE